MGLRDLIGGNPLTAALARKVLRLLRRIKLLPIGEVAAVSTNYEKLNSGEVVAETARLRASWQDEALPARQRALVDRQLAAYRAGESVDVFDVFNSVVKDIESRVPVSSLLEIGCSSGYYSEVLKISKSSLAYTGCDYSQALIRLARERHPDVPFDIEDATRLSYPNRAFDIVVSGCCLLHIPEYQKAIAETARVSSKAVIFHRTPVLENAPTEFFRKEAYGVETFEIHFGEVELLDLFSKSGLKVDKHVDLARERQANGVVMAVRTYLCSMSGAA
jgi:SAM-dependent methyltransferase